MQVDVTERRQVEHPLRNDAAVADDHNNVRLETGLVRAEFVVVLDLIGLRDRQSQLQRGLFDRRGNYFQNTALVPVRLGENELNRKSGRDERFKSEHGKARRTAEYETQRHWVIV